MKKRHVVLYSSIVLTILLVASLFVIQKYRCEDGYVAEQKRFSKVLNKASDEELLTVLKYALAHHYVPNHEVDPYFDMYVMVGCWKRSLMVYERLKPREDLLQLIYPDLEVLDDYIEWGHQSGAPYPDTLVSKAILDNVGKDILKVEQMMGDWSNCSSLWYKYFATPILYYVND